MSTATCSRVQKPATGRRPAIHIIAFVVSIIKVAGFISPQWCVSSAFSEAFSTGNTLHEQIMRQLLARRISCVASWWKYGDSILSAGKHLWFRYSIAMELVLILALLSRRHQGNQYCCDMTLFKGATARKRLEVGCYSFQRTSSKP